MRARWFVLSGVVGVVGVLAITGIGVGTTHLLSVRHHDLLLRQQRSAYVAGHRAYLTADCATADPLLAQATAAQSDEATADLARTEQAACTDWQSVQKNISRETTGPATIVLMDYLSGKRAAPLAAAARRTARITLGSSLKTHNVGETLCNGQTSLVRTGILKVRPSDPLAAPFLEACARQWAHDDYWPRSRTAFQTLAKDYPHTAEGRNALPQLVKASLTQARVRSKKPLNMGSNGRPDASLHGKIRIELAYNRPLEFSTSGTKDSFTGVSCHKCSQRPFTSYATCVKHAHHKTIVLPHGPYTVQVRFLSVNASGDNRGGTPDPYVPNSDWVLSGKITLRANDVYQYCVS